MSDSWAAWKAGSLGSSSGGSDIFHQKKKPDALEGALKKSLDIASKPLSGIDAVLGAPERFVQGSFSGLGEGFYEALHPSDTGRSARQLEKIEETFGLGHMKGAGKIAEDTIAQTLLDPLTYASLAGLPKVGARVAKALSETKLLKEGKLADAFRLQPKEALEGYKPSAPFNLNKLSEAYRAALFVNPLPHMFNISRLAYLGGGLPAVGRELKYLVRGVPEDVKKSVGEAGIEVPEYISGPKTGVEEWLSKNQNPLNPFTYIGKMRDTGQKLLTRTEESARAGLYKTLEKQRGYKPRYKAFHAGPETPDITPHGGVEQKLPGMGGGVEEDLFGSRPGAVSEEQRDLAKAAFNATKIKHLNKGEAEDIGRDVGRSMGNMGQQTSKAIKWATAHGAPFAPWRLGVVPQAISKAILEHPERAERYARLLGTTNQDLGTNIELMGPEEDFGKLADFPMGSIKYGGTTMGPVGSTLAASYQGPKSMEQALKASLLSLIPGSAIMESFPALDPYKEGGNIPLNVLLRLIGGYSK